MTATAGDWYLSGSGQQTSSREVILEQSWSSTPGVRKTSGKVLKVKGDQMFDRMGTSVAFSGYSNTGSIKNVGYGGDSVNSPYPHIQWGNAITLGRRGANKYGYTDT